MAINGDFQRFQYLKAAATDMKCFARSKFSRSLVHKKNSGSTCQVVVTFRILTFVKRGSIPLLSLNELGEKSPATKTLGKFVSKP